MLVVASDGYVYLTDNDLNDLKTPRTVASNAIVRKAFVFETSACDFLSNSSKARLGSTLVLFLEEEDILRVIFVVAGKDDEVAEPQDCGFALNSKVRMASFV